MNDDDDEHFVRKNVFAKNSLNSFVHLFYIMRGQKIMITNLTMKPSKSSDRKKKIFCVYIHK